MRVGTVLIMAMGALCPLAMGNGNTGVLVVVSYESPGQSLVVAVAVAGPGGATYSATLHDDDTVNFVGLAEGSYTVTLTGAAGSTVIAEEVLLEMYAGVARLIQVGVAADGSPVVVCTATGPGSDLLPESVVGLVVDAYTDEPIVGAEVVVVGASLSTTTDDNGLYVFPSLLPGIREICVTVSEYPEHCALVEGTSDQNFLLFPAAEGEGEGELPCSLIGHVTDAQTQAAIAGATLTIAAIGNASVVTDASGAYVFAAIPCGLYQVAVSADGYDSQSEWVVVESDSVATLSFELDAAGELPCTLVVYVADADTGAPIPDATVTIVALDTSEETDADGVYVFAAIPCDPHQVEASAAGYCTQQKWVTVVAGEVATLDFALSTSSCVCNAGAIGPPTWRGPGNAAGDLFVLALVLALLSAARRRRSAPRATP